MTGESRLADLQCVYQFTHAQFPAPESSNNANACRIYDSLPKGGKVSHYLLYIGICRYIKRDVNALGMALADVQLSHGGYEREPRACSGHKAPA